MNLARAVALDAKLTERRTIRGELLNAVVAPVRHIQVARAIHRVSSRTKLPFVTLNCAAVPEQLGLSVVWTAAARRGITVEQIVRWMGSAPATLVGLEKRKGRIAEGCDADLVVWDPDAEVVVDPKKLYHRHPLTPYAGNRLHGVVSETFLRGRVVYRDGAFRAPRGVMLAASPVPRTHA